MFIRVSERRRPAQQLRKQDRSQTNLTAGPSVTIRADLLQGREVDSLLFAGGKAIAMVEARSLVLLAILLTVTLWSVRAGPADAVSDRHSGTEEAIKTIRSQYAQVNRDLHMCRQVKRELEGDSSQGGELTDYLLKSSVRKAVVPLGHERGQTLREYYFWDDQLFFVFEVRLRYNQNLDRIGWSNQVRISSRLRNRSVPFR